MYLPPGGIEPVPFRVGATAQQKSPRAEVKHIIALSTRAVKRKSHFFAIFFIYIINVQFFAAIARPNILLYFFKFPLAKEKKMCYNSKVTKGYSSVGRTPVSKTGCRGFESSCPCQTKGQPFGWSFCLVGWGCENPRRALHGRGEVCGFACKMAVCGRQANSQQACYRHAQYGSESSCPCQKSTSFDRSLSIFTFSLFTFHYYLPVDFWQVISNSE